MSSSRPPLASAPRMTSGGPVLQAIRPFLALRDRDQNGLARGGTEVR